MSVNSRSHPDYWASLARKRGYPARSVFKLEEIQKKWKPLQRGKAVLDIGASPGSWSLFALRTLGERARVTAIDLNPLRIQAPPGTVLRFLQANVFSDEARVFLQQELPYGCILSDAAPSTSGNRLVDCGRSLELVSKVLEMAGEYLAPNGNCVIKLFQGDNMEDIVKDLKSKFREVRTFRPKAVRNDSMEVYIINLGFEESLKNPYKP